MQRIVHVITTLRCYDTFQKILSQKRRRFNIEMTSFIYGAESFTLI